MDPRHLSHVRAGEASNEGQLIQWGWSPGEQWAPDAWTSYESQQQPPASALQDGAAAGYYPSAPQALVGQANSLGWTQTGPPDTQHWPTSCGPAASSSIQHAGPVSTHNAFSSHGFAHCDPPRYEHLLPEWMQRPQAIYYEPYTAQQAGLPFADLPAHPPSTSHHQYIHPPPPPPARPPDASLAPEPFPELPRAFQKRRLEQYPFLLGAPTTYVAHSDGVGGVSVPTSLAYPVRRAVSPSVALPQVATFAPELPLGLEVNNVDYAPFTETPHQQPQSSWFSSAPPSTQISTTVGYNAQSAPTGQASLSEHFRAFDASTSDDRPLNHILRGSDRGGVSSRSSSAASLQGRRPTGMSTASPSTFTLPIPDTSQTAATNRSGQPVDRTPASAAPPSTSIPVAEQLFRGFPSPSCIPEDEQDTAQVVALALIRRALHETLPAPLAYKPARGAGGHSSRPSDTPSAGTSTRIRPVTFSRRPDPDREELEERDLLRTRGKMNRNQQKEISSIEVLARCATCSVVDPSGAAEPRTLARLVLRALPPHLVRALEDGADPTALIRVGRSAEDMDSGASCWACLGMRPGQDGVVRAGHQSHSDEGSFSSTKTSSAAGVRHQKKGYEATLSAAIDELEQLGLGGADVGSESASPGSAAAVDMSPRQQEQDESAWAEYKSLLLMKVGRAPLRYKDAWLRCDVSDGRKTCQLSHARNPALGEVTIDVLAVVDIPPEQLDALESRCRAIFFNSRLAVVARPEFLLRGDGLARSFREAEAVTVDHWGQLATFLRDPTPEGRNVKRYVTAMYSRPRKRHPKRGKGKVRENGQDTDARLPERVAFGFAITEADFCCAMPWPVNGQAFDATTFLGEATTQRVKADRLVINQQRALANPPLPPLPPIRYNYIASPFRVGSRANAGLARRGYETLDELEERDPLLKREWFRVGWLPEKYAKALTIFVRRLESEEDLGGPPAENVPRKRVRKAPTVTTATNTPSSASPQTSSQSVEPVAPEAVLFEPGPLELAFASRYPFAANELAPTTVQGPV